MSRYATNFALAFVLLLFCTTLCSATLSSHFYDRTCPRALSTIRTSINRAIARQRRMAASLIRLHFHDCFVRGCDASVLLVNSSSFVSEQEAGQNKNSAIGFEVIEEAKLHVERLCPGVVSCADILAVAARDSSVYVGGPSWTVKLGRRDSTRAFLDEAITDLPRFDASLQSLIELFGNKNLSARDMVALSGSHTIGQAQCLTFRGRIYNTSSDIDANFARTRQRRCPATPQNGDTNLAPLDLVTPNQLDNNYFKNLIQKKGLLASDQILFSGSSTDSIVTEYSRNRKSFSADFAAAMVRMGDIEPLTGSSGQIRRICSVVN